MKSQKLEIKIHNTVNDYLENIGEEMNTNNENYYLRLAEYLLDEGNINQYKPLLVTGASGLGKTTPFKALRELNTNLVNYHDFQSFRNYDQFYQTIEKIKNFRYSHGVGITYLNAALNICVVDNFGAQMKVNNYGEQINVIQYFLSHIHELNFGTSQRNDEMIKYNKLIVVTGLTIDQIIENMEGSEHLVRRFFDLFPESNIITL